MITSPVQRRIVGFALFLLILALGFVGIQTALSAPAGSFKVNAELGTVGSGLYEGADVKYRGVIVGTVSKLDYDGFNARAELTIDREPAFPDPSRLQVAVTQKTLLGEKQVEIRVDDADFPATGEALVAGDTILADENITELDDVIDRLSPFLRAVDSEDLATIFETFSAQEGTAETIQANLDVGSDLANFGARVSNQVSDRLTRLGDVGDTLLAAADDLDRLAANTPAGTEFIRTRTAELDALLLDVSSFAVTTAEWLEVEEDLFDRVLDSGDPVLDLLERNDRLLGDAVQGLYRYTFNLGHEPGWLTDGTGWAGFRIFVDSDELVTTLCADAGPLGAVIPLCSTEAAS